MTLFFLKHKYDIMISLSLKLFFREHFYDLNVFIPQNRVIKTFGASKKFIKFWSSSENDNNWSLHFWSIFQLKDQLWPFSEKRDQKVKKLYGPEAIITLF